MNEKYEELNELEELFADAIETSNSYLEEMYRLASEVQELETEDEGVSYMLSAMCEHITEPQMVDVLFDFIKNGWIKISVGKKIEDFPLVFALPKVVAKQSMEFSVAFYEHDENAVFTHKLIVFSKDGIVTKITYSKKKNKVG